MTSLAGAVQAVDSEDVLESLRVNGSARSASETIAGAPSSRTFQTSLGIDPAVDLAPSSAARQAAIEEALSRSSAVYLVAKRATDIVGSLIGLLLISPIVALVGILTKLSDGGPLFYPHTRVGKWGREFTCYKFRTMVVDAEKIKADMAHMNTHDDHRTFKVPDDPRVTRIGRWLRRASIDEMPQLWNVLRGEMSLVGPRPPVPTEVGFYDLDDMQRLLVKPGLTCIWQVSGRSRLPFPKQLEMDLEYIERRNYWFDLKLMLRTLPAVLSADGAY
jgi:lipopolysaccharide/colanic/teichoic acid biosynthesis glycosyltransferase